MTASPVSRRAAGVQPFRVMELLARARAAEAGGRDIVHMEMGEPDFPAPRPVIEAAQAALARDRTHYTPALGLPELREAVAAFYDARYGLRIGPSRVVITPGSSGALQLALAALLDVGDELLLPDPSYPCNRQIAAVLGARTRRIAVDADSEYQPTPDALRRSWTEGTRALLLASPSNPCGSVLERPMLQALAGATRECGGDIIADEIYHGLSYGQATPSTLEVDAEAWVVNSFSKYFGMTGFRVGWLVAPDEAMPAVERMAQNLFISASSLGQYAALAAFHPATIEILEARREEFRRRRDFLVPALRELGFGIPLVPQGAFYVYADASAFTTDAYAFALKLLDEIGVVITPGLDFGEHLASRHVRFAYSTSLERLEEGVRRLGNHLRGTR